MVVAVIESLTEYLPLTARVSSSVTVPSFSRSFHGAPGLPPACAPFSKSSHTSRPAQSSPEPAPEAPAEPPFVTTPPAPPLAAPAPLLPALVPPVFVPPPPVVLLVPATLVVPAALL